MDLNMEIIESLLTGSPAMLTAQEKELNMTSGNMAHDENLDVNLGLTMSNDTASLTSSVESPSRRQGMQLSTPLRQQMSIAMKTPGLIIPTPALSRLNIDQNESCEKYFDADDGLEITLEVQPSESSEAVIGYDDTAFLPDDFGSSYTPVRRTGEEKVFFANSPQKLSSMNVAKMQAIIDAAVNGAKAVWVEQMKQKMEEEITERVQKEAQASLEKHGAEWSAEHDEAVATLYSQMNAIVEAKTAEIEKELAVTMATKVQSTESKYEAILNTLTSEHAFEMNELQNRLNLAKNCFESENMILQQHVAELGNAVSKDEVERLLGELETKALEATLSMEAKHVAAIKKIEDDHETERNQHQIKHDIAIEAVKTNLERDLALNVDTELNRLRAEHNVALASISDSHRLELGRLTNELTEQHLCDLKELNLQMEMMKAEHVEEMKRTAMEVVDLVQKETSEQTEMVHEIKRLHAEIDILTSQERQIRADFQAQHDVLTNQFRQAFDEQRDVAAAEKKSEVAALINQFESERQAQGTAFALEKTLLTEKIKDLEEALLSASVTRETAIAEIEDLHHIKCEQINADIAAERCAWNDQKGALDSEIQLLENRLLALTTEHSRQIDEMIAQHDTERSQSKNKHDLAVADLRSQMEREKEEALSQLRSPSSRETDLINKLSTIEADSQSALAEFQTRLQEIRQEHNAEIDEFISQLDVVEAENKRESAALESKMKQKDAIIAALGTQLAEATSRNNELDVEYQNYKDALKESIEESHLAKLQCTTLTANLEMIKIEHKKAIDEEKRKRHEARDNIRDEMFTAAEEQFAKANVEYLRLKDEFEATTSKLGKVEHDFRTMSMKLEVTKKEQATKEMELTAELAQARAIIATNEAGSARRNQEYTIGEEKLKATLIELQAMLDESNENCKSAHLSLGGCVAEKEKLAKENRDLKEVCEELMAMIETEKQS